MRSSTWFLSEILVKTPIALVAFNCSFNAARSSVVGAADGGGAAADGAAGFGAGAAAFGFDALGFGVAALGVGVAALGVGVAALGVGVPAVGVVPLGCSALFGCETGSAVRLAQPAIGSSNRTAT